MGDFVNHRKETETWKNSEMSRPTISHRSVYIHKMGSLAMHIKVIEVERIYLVYDLYC